MVDKKIDFFALYYEFFTFSMNIYFKANTMKELLIAQISDMHIVENNNTNNINNRQLEKTIEKINDFKPKIDLVVATGDLTDNGLFNEYKILKNILSLSIPDVFVIPGNHDNRENILRTFPYQKYLHNKKFFCYSLDHLPVILIFLDTLKEGKPEGEICIDRISWLSKKLLEHKNKPVIIFLHHPPFDTGIWWMDAIGLKGRKKLKNLIEKFDNIEAVFAGHVHRPIQKKWARTLGQIAPSTAHQIELDLYGDKFLHINDEPTGFSLHHWKQNNGLTSHICYIKKSNSYVNSKIKDVKKFKEYFKKAHLEFKKNDT